MIATKKQFISMLRLLNRTTPTQGFILAEVLVAGLLTMTFVLISMQVIVMGTAVRVRGEEINEATKWTQEDLSNIVTISKSMNYCNAGSTDTTCAGIVNNFKTDAATCDATASGSGYGSVLSTAISGTQNIARNSVIGNRPYTLRRETSVKNEAPYNILQLTYRVYKGSSATGTPFYTFYSEVIPGASLACR